MPAKRRETWVKVSVLLRQHREDKIVEEQTRSGHLRQSSASSANFLCSFMMMSFTLGGYTLFFVMMMSTGHLILFKEGVSSSWRQDSNYFFRCCYPVSLKRCPASLWDMPFVDQETCWVPFLSCHLLFILFRVHWRTSTHRKPSFPFNALFHTCFDRHSLSCCCHSCLAVST